jgi:hypothetical protein
MRYKEFAYHKTAYETYGPMGMRKHASRAPAGSVHSETTTPARTLVEKDRNHRCRRAYSCLLLASTQYRVAGEAVRLTVGPYSHKEDVPALTRVREGPFIRWTRVSRRSSSTGGDPLRLRRSSCRARSDYSLACTLQEGEGQTHLKETVTAPFRAANARSSARRRAASRFWRAAERSVPPRDPPVVPLCTR